MATAASPSHLPARRTLGVLSLTAVAALATACGGAGAATTPSSSPVAAIDTSRPLAPGEFQVVASGPLSGELVPIGTAECDLDGGYGVELAGTVAGAPVEIDLSYVFYKAPGTFPVRGTDITIDVNHRDQRRDWRNQGTDSGDGTVTYAPDGTTGSFTATLPEISYETAAVLPDRPPLTVEGRWSCDPNAS